MRTIAAAIAGLAMGTLVGCGEAGLGIDIHYEDTGGLAVGDRVFYADIPIGEVTGVSKGGPRGAAVHVKIRKDFEHLVTEYARFYIVPDPENAGKQAVELTRTQKGGALLKEGARVEGAVPIADRYGRVLEDVQKGLDELKDELESFSKDLARIPESEEYRRLKLKMERLVEDLKRSGRDAKEKIEKEILPALQKELEELKKRLMKRKKEETPGPIQV